MKAFTISTALALLTSLVSAAPATTPHEARQFRAQITFIGAANGLFFQSVPTDGSVFSISKFLPDLFPCSTKPQEHQDTPFHPALSVPLTLIPAAGDLSVSMIRSEGGATCTFNGIDGSSTTVVGAQTVDVGPPQTQISGSCRAF
ncbi:MAG: hypothetical protein LQ348_002155 [Seirophora lacunosa]|nr:MAG: hypothetical protein LQ348_002155 [Seirophora lacunosa]